MSRAGFLRSLIYGLVLLGLVTLQAGWLLLAIPLLVYLAAGQAYTPDVPKLTASRRLERARIAQGEHALVTLKLRNEGAALEEVFVTDLLPGGLKPVDGNHTVLAPLGAKETLELRYTLKGERGLHQFAGVRVEVREAFGLFSQSLTLELPDRLVVTPRALSLKRATVRPRRTRVYAGLIPANQGGPGVAFFGLREYQPGDERRWINARVSARYEDTLVVNAYEQERTADITLILDVRRQSNRAGNVSLLEHGVQAAATLAGAFLQSANRVGLLIYGSHLDWTFAGYGKVQLERVLQALARAEEGERFSSFEAIPARFFPPRSQLILLSPLLLEDAAALRRLRAQGFPLTVFSPSPLDREASEEGRQEVQALAARIVRFERALLLRKLRQAGIQVVDWPLGAPFEEVAQRAFGRVPAPWRVAG